MESMKQLKDLIVSARTDQIKAKERLGILEGVVADFFRLHLERADHAALVDGIEQLSRKLLRMQGDALADLEAASMAMAEIQAGFAARAQEQIAAAAAPAPEPEPLDPPLPDVLE